MNVIKEELNGVKLIEPKVFHDERGYFFESFNEDKFADLVGSKIKFVQDNESRSKKNVLRGLHFQKPPFSQGKLVRVPKGKIIDIVVDLRKSSPTYGEYASFELSSENKLMLWIPEGFAHGFISLEENTILNYKCTDYYHPEAEETLLWNDSQLNINWTEDLNSLIISEKDLNGKQIVEIETIFE